MGGRDENRATRVSSLTNEEPLMVVKACVDIMLEVVRKNRGNGCNSVIGERETPLCHGGSGGIRKRAFRAENRDIGGDWSGSSHWGSEALASRGGDKDIVGVDGDVLMKWGKEKGIEDFLSYLGGSGRHGWKGTVQTVPL